MANTQHIEWLLEGVKAWNARRERKDFTPDFEGADLYVAFKYANKLDNFGLMPLQGADLEGADLQGADLQGANLLQADLRWADLRGADLRGANLGGANLQGADLRGADLRGADLRGADLRGANLGGANLQGADLQNVELLGAYVTTIVYSGAGTNDVSAPEYTDLSTTRFLTQAQLDAMQGDGGTKLPHGLKKPEHWPDLEEEKGPNPAAIENPPQAETDPLPASVAPPAVQADNPEKQPSHQLFVTQIQKKSTAELRASLDRDYAKPAALADYMVAQVQRELAAHEMTPKPNTEEGVSEWNAHANFLRENLLALTSLSQALPVQDHADAEDISESKLKKIRDSLAKLAAQLDKVVCHMDDNSGLIGNAWKIGQIGALTQVLLAFGITMPVAAPIAAGVVGVNTVRILIGKD